VEGPTLEDCFARAAAGVFASFVPPPPPSAARTEVELEVEAADGEELLVAWLEELLFRSETSRLLFDSFEVESLDGDRLRGRASGRTQAVGEELAGPGIKGVTRHGLRLEEHQGGWRARVYLDV
jgi:SHS2 domain-containing protein